MKKFEVISPFLDFDDQTIEIGAIIEIDESRETALKKACVIGEHPIKDESKKKTTKRSD
ncbi:hypothetical protein M5X06_28090 [Paenibacillus alvei]|uniref:Uncharacterized protein n=1 Tax=Paenibacillus alvei TaxID=44250 RepID=A0ABT4GQV8_PAEAL|nr:hypothetical protein [Paenibacillus alvei]MCY9758968.1 hypothetical protein [Paenibacillus alvei]MCY9770641.1 hypothetical protein [Paenibacillus alvei]